ncbi:hypothetical protein SCD92_15590 [Gilvimarinus sp. SDUM040013]|uniref:Uncharacterized protein n=1 Tax=Gilvimarinus gilvus TaxID=3058038 RepID=A0ABU4S323_9GAMM|nr:hypothetical protein [Gilvimarinus sp. SDUM040013]MDX6850796.1 hypothetical protein [Gilvimarinus sp. SDUM040013]
MATPALTTVSQGESLSIDFTPNEGQQLISATGCGGALIGLSFEIDEVVESCEVSAEFAPVPVSVTVDVNEHGSYQGLPTALLYGENTAIELIPEEGFYLESATGCDGQLIDNTFTIEFLRESCTVAVEFAVLPPLPDAFDYTYRYINQNRLEFQATLPNHADALNVIEVDVFGERSIVGEFEDGSHKQNVSVFLLDAVNNTYVVEACNITGCVEGSMQGLPGNFRHAIGRTKIEANVGNYEILAFSESGEYVALYAVGEEDRCDRSVIILREENDEWIDYFTIEVTGYDFIIEANFSGNGEKLALVQGPYAGCGDNPNPHEFTDETVIVRYFDVSEKTEKSSILAKSMEGLIYWHSVHGSAFSFDGKQVALVYANWMFTFEWKDNGWLPAEKLHLIDGYNTDDAISFSRDGEKLLLASAINLNDSEADSLDLAKVGMVAHNIPPKTCEFPPCFGAVYVYEKLEQWELSAALDAKVIDKMDALDGAHFGMEVNADATRFIMFSRRANFFITYNMQAGEWVREEDYYLAESASLMRMSASGNRLFYWDGGPKYLRWGGRSLERYVCA